MWWLTFAIRRTSNEWPSWCALADAVVENYLPSQVTSLGIDRLRAINPECVWVSITPATVGGPVADQPSFDLLAQAPIRNHGCDRGAGRTSDEGWRTHRRRRHRTLTAAIGLLAGLFARLQGRPGRHFEAPLLEVDDGALW